MIVYGRIVNTLLTGPSVLNQYEAQSIRTNRQTDERKLRVAFRNFRNFENFPKDDLNLVKFFPAVYLSKPARTSFKNQYEIQRSRVRFPALPDFLSSSGSGTGSTQPREVN